jgi:hypothetical protein
VKAPLLTRLHRFFVHNWRAKLASLLAAGAVWYLIKRDLDQSLGGPLLRPTSRSAPRFP